jgi:hypothetical protein
VDERRQKAFDFAADSSRQMVTLSTAIVALTVTFASEIFGNPSDLETSVLVAAWIAYLASIIGGVWTMLALTGTLEPTNGETVDPSIRGGNVRTPAFVQTIAFVLATLLIVVFGALSVF